MSATWRRSPRVATIDRPAKENVRASAHLKPPRARARPNKPCERYRSVRGDRNSVRGCRCATIIYVKQRDCARQRNKVRASKRRLLVRDKRKANPLRIAKGAPRRGAQEHRSTKPGTMDNLSRIRGRSRRIVARDPAHLFEKPHLVKDYAQRLSNGWYYGTNNSSRETGVWLQRAAECTGLAIGTDFAMSLNVGRALADL